MRVEIKINHAEGITVEQNREHTTLTVKSLTGTVPTVGVTLNTEQLDDLIQTLELARDSWKRRGRKRDL